MKNEFNEQFYKRNILIFDKKIRYIQNTQIYEYEKVIHTYLAQLYPDLVNKNENGIIDWTCDIINCSDNQEVLETLSRIEDILISSKKENWTCSICNKFTKNVDSEFLSGKDHLSCILENEKESTEEDIVSINKFVDLHKELLQLKSHISNLEEKLLKINK